MPSTKSPSSQRSFWQPHALAWQRSELSKARYCREHELNYHQFNYWLARLTTPAVSVGTAAMAPKFLPVALEQRQASPGLKITLPNGIIIDGVTEESVKLLGAAVAQL